MDIGKWWSEQLETNARELTDAQGIDPELAAAVEASHGAQAELANLFSKFSEDGDSVPTKRELAQLIFLGNRALESRMLVYMTNNTLRLSRAIEKK